MKAFQNQNSHQCLLSKTVGTKSAVCVIVCPHSSVRPQQKELSDLLYIKNLLPPLQLSACFSICFSPHKLRGQHFPLLRYVPWTRPKVITAIETPCMLNASCENQHATNWDHELNVNYKCEAASDLYPVSFFPFSGKIHISQNGNCYPSVSDENVEVNSSQLNSMTQRLSKSLFVWHTAFRRTWGTYVGIGLPIHTCVSLVKSPIAAILQQYI